MAEGEGNILPEDTQKPEEFKLVEAPLDPATKETLEVVRTLGSKKYHRVMGNLDKPGHRTHNPARGRSIGPRRTRKPF